MFKNLSYTLLFCLSLSSLTAFAADLAIVIDDVGYNEYQGRRAMSLPGQVNLAVLPFAPHTQSLIKQASERDIEIIIHQPMEPQPAPHVTIEHDTLTMGMAAEEISMRVQRALEAVPQRVGVSNHAGSLLTQHAAPMRTLMHTLREHGLFFLDSRTTAATVAEQTAIEQGVVALRRDVFLDHVRTPEAIHAAFQRVKDIARTKGSAILIAHPYPISLSYLEQSLAELPDDIRLVKLSDLALRRQASFALRLNPTSLHISHGQ